jgi:energy-coupling factor transport system ATP-binding protein
MENARIRMTGTTPEIFSRASELKEMGLAVPQITEVFLKLRELGLNVDTSVYTVEQARRRILEMRGERDA